MKYTSIFSFIIGILVIPQKISGQNLKIITEDTKLVKLADHFDFTEGPAVDSHGNVYFTDQPNDQILKWSVGGELEVFLTPSGRSNGLYFDTKDNLFACADELGELWKIDANKNIQVLLKDFQGKRFNGPNDLGLIPKEGSTSLILFINGLIGNILLRICLRRTYIIYHRGAQQNCSHWLRSTQWNHRDT